MFTWGYIMTLNPRMDDEAASFSQEPVELPGTLRCQHGQPGKLRTKLACQYIFQWEDH